MGHLHKLKSPIITDIESNKDDMAKLYTGHHEVIPNANCIAIENKEMQISSLWH